MVRMTAGAAAPAAVWDAMETGMMISSNKNHQVSHLQKIQMD